MKTIGIIMEDRKFKALGFQQFVDSCRRDDICFRKITDFDSLKNQGPFDVVVHKTLHLMSSATSSPDTIDFASLKEYFQSNNVIVIDPIASISVILDRFSQYGVIKQSLIRSSLHDQVFVPSFCLYDETLNAQRLTDFKMKFPILVKPLAAHGKGLSHKMMLIFNETDLAKVKAPALLQNFENHGGFLVKVYVVGDYYHLVTRPSIRDLSTGDRAVVEFCSHDVSKEFSRSPLNNAKTPSAIDDVDMDRDLVHQAVKCFRERLRLDLFGVDLIICDGNDSGVSKLAVIDLNIFPDYSCVPNFFVHLENLCRQKLGLSELVPPV